MASATATPAPETEVSEPKAIKKLNIEKDARIELVPLNKTAVDKRYQRPIGKKYEAMGRNWNSGLAGVIVVSDRGDNKYWIVDGQNRVRASEIAGNKEILADIREGLSVEEEAALFDQLNSGRSYVAALDRFRARLVYGDEIALTIASIVEKHGGAIRPSWGGPGAAKSQAEGDIRAITSVERVYKHGGPDFLDELLGVIQDAWASLDYDTVNEYTMGGLRNFYDRQAGNFTRQRLVERLSEEGWGSLRRMAHAHGQIFGGSGPVNFYRAIVEAYNKNLAPRNRLRP